MSCQQFLLLQQKEKSSYACTVIACIATILTGKPPPFFFFFLLAMCLSLQFFLTVLRTLAKQNFLHHQHDVIRVVKHEPLFFCVKETTNPSFSSLSCFCSRPTIHIKERQSQFSSLLYIPAACRLCFFSGVRICTT